MVQWYSLREHSVALGERYAVHDGEIQLGADYAGNGRIRVVIAQPRLAPQEEMDTAEARVTGEGDKVDMAASLEAESSLFAEQVQRKMHDFRIMYPNLSAAHAVCPPKPPEVRLRSGWRWIMVSQIEMAGGLVEQVWRPAREVVGTALGRPTP